MKVLKFGGTSVGSPERMKEVSRLITEDGQQKLVVLSAMSGTTNSLVEIAQYLYGGNKTGADDVINRLRTKYYAHVPELLSKKENQDELQKFLEDKFSYLQSFYIDNFSEKEEKIILAQGELISTYMVTLYLKEQGIKAALLPALDFMKTDADAEPDMADRTTSFCCPSSVTRRLTSFILWGLPTDVPPNFSTFIMVVFQFTFKKISSQLSIVNSQLSIVPVPPHPQSTCVPHT